MLSFRNQQKLEMIRKRGGFDLYSQIKCDLCGINRGSAMHELIKRSQTINGSTARELSFQKELCSLLCNDCHAVADTKDIDEKLWLFNIQLWGIIEIHSALDRLNEYVRRPFQIGVINEYSE